MCCAYLSCEYRWPTTNRCLLAPSFHLSHDRIVVIFLRKVIAQDTEYHFAVVRIGTSISQLVESRGHRGRTHDGINLVRNSLTDFRRSTIACNRWQAEF